MKGSKITFLDTPGHAAFSAMRARGAKVTDLIVLVVAAGDGVMAQTREVIELSRDNEIPLIVAINKCDAFGPDAIQKAKDSLMREQVLLEEIGGDTQSVSVSALTGMGVDNLLEAIGAQAEIMDLEVDTEATVVRASVIEARVVRGQGDAATVIVQEGVLRPGNILVGEESYCRVRTMLDHSGKHVFEAGPSDPVEITGWKGHPEAGNLLKQVSSEHEAQALVGDRIRVKDEVEALDAVEQAKDREALDDKIWKMIKAENQDPTSSPRKVRTYDEVEGKSGKPELLIILKCDAMGSLEALEKVLSEIPQSKCRLSIIGSGVGTVTPSDVEHAKATRSTIVAFNTTVERACKIPRALSLLKHRVIYHLVDELKSKMIKLIPPVYKEETLGRAKVLQVFSIDGRSDDIVAGCMVVEGSVARNPTTSKSAEGLPPPEIKVTLSRGPEKIKEYIRIKSMRHLKKEISSAGKGMECGILIEDDGAINLQAGDIITQTLRTPSFDVL